VNALSGSLGSLSNTVASQSLALSQMQSIVNNLSVNSGSTNNNTSTTIIVQTGAITSSGAIELTQSGMIIDQIRTETPVVSVYETIMDRIAHALGIIREIVVGRIIAIRGYFEEVWAKKLHSEEVHTDTLCMKKSNGSEICITGDQLQSIMTSQSVAPVQQVSSSPVSSTSTPTSSPTPVDSGSTTPTATPESTITTTPVITESAPSSTIETVTETGPTGVDTTGTTATVAP
jgi:hypothetical protein